MLASSLSDYIRQMKNLRDYWCPIVFGGVLGESIYAGWDDRTPSPNPEEYVLRVFGRYVKPICVIKRSTVDANYISEAFES